jgi:hypothetical protein
VLARLPGRRYFASSAPRPRPLRGLNLFRPRIARAAQRAADPRPRPRPPPGGSKEALLDELVEVLAAPAPSATPTRCSARSASGRGAEHRHRQRRRHPARQERRAFPRSPWRPGSPPSRWTSTRSTASRSASSSCWSARRSAAGQHVKALSRISRLVRRESPSASGWSRPRSAEEFVRSSGGGSRVKRLVLRVGTGRGVGGGSSSSSPRSTLTIPLPAIRRWTRWAHFGAYPSSGALLARAAWTHRALPLGGRRLGVLYGRHRRVPPVLRPRPDAGVRRLGRRRRRRDGRRLPPPPLALPPCARPARRAAPPRAAQGSRA